MIRPRATIWEFSAEIRLSVFMYKLPSDLSTYICYIFLAILFIYISGGVLNSARFNCKATRLTSSVATTQGVAMVWTRLPSHGLTDLMSPWVVTKEAWFLCHCYHCLVYCAEPMSQSNCDTRLPCHGFIIITHSINLSTGYAIREFLGSNLDPEIR